MNTQVVESSQQASKNSHRFQGIILMTIVVLIWASMPVAIKGIISSISPPVQIAIRFTIATVIFAPFARNLNLGLVRDAVIIGLLMFVAFISETIGLQTIAANQASFVYGLLVIFVTLFEVVFYRRLSLVAILAAVLAFAGIGIMSWQSNSYPIGLVWMIICALFSSAAMILFEKLGSRHSVLSLTLVQLLLIAILSWLWAGSELIGQFDVISTNLTNPKNVLTLVYLSVVGTGINTWLTAKALGMITAFEAALIQTLEPIFGAIFAFFLLGETFGINAYVGAPMVITGMIMALDEKKVDIPTDNKNEFILPAENKNEFILPTEDASQLGLSQVEEQLPEVKPE